MLPSPLIDPARLRSLLGSAAGRFDVDALAECESTSSLLLDRAALGAPAGSVVVADRQTAGRGRRGRHWLSAPESSLTFSLLWRFSGGVERLAGLSLAVGVAVARALEAMGVAELRLKWPNDILLGNGKLGGILIEIQQEMRHDARHSEPRGMLAVIGIGLNLQAPPGEADFGQPATALDAALPQLPERHDLLAQLLTELALVLDRFDVAGFAAWRDEWQARHAWQGRPVRLLHDGQLQLEGICRGADADGALLVETAAGLERCLSGDLSLRAA